MAWDDEIVTVVRALVQDFSDDTTGTAAKYSDDSLATLILVAGLNVQGRVSLPVHYKINVANGTLSPDPTSTTTRDDNAINLFSLRAACLLINAEIREYTGQGISVRDGTSAVSLSRSPASLKLMQQTYCDGYETAEYQYKIGASECVVGEALLGPVKAWYFNGCGGPFNMDFGMYAGPNRIGRGGGGGGDGWYGGGFYGGGCGCGAGGNWGN